MRLIDKAITYALMFMIFVGVTADCTKTASKEETMPTGFTYVADFILAYN